MDPYRNVILPRLRWSHPLGLTLVAFAPTFFAMGSISWSSIHTVL